MKKNILLLLTLMACIPFCGTLQANSSPNVQTEPTTEKSTTQPKIRILSGALGGMKMALLTFAIYKGGEFLMSGLGETLLTGAFIGGIITFWHNILSHSSKKGTSPA